MSWRTIVVTGQAKLDYKLDYVVIRKKESTTKIHLSEIAILIIESTQVSLTSLLISKMIEKKIKIILCDSTHNPCGEVVPYYGSFDTSQKIKRQIDWTSDVKNLVWTEIVSHKIKKQSEHLFDRGLEDEARLLTEYVKELVSGDKTNREGHAAKVYFNALFGMEFTRSDDNYVNAALNYGYGIVLASFTREIVSNGYITQIGIHHDNMFNQFNLASDLMEPFRIIVDRQVADMHLEKFEHDEKMEVLKILTKKVIIDQKTQYLIPAIRIYCKSIFEALNEEDVSLIRMYRNEL